MDLRHVSVARILSLRYHVLSSKLDCLQVEFGAQEASTEGTGRAEAGPEVAGGG